MFHFPRVRSNNLYKKDDDGGHSEEMFYDEGGEVLEQVDLRSCGCPIFKVRLDEALSNVIWWKMSLMVF